MIVVEGENAGPQVDPAGFLPDRVNLVEWISHVPRTNPSYMNYAGNPWTGRTILEGAAQGMGDDDFPVGHFLRLTSGAAVMTTGDTLDNGEIERRLLGKSGKFRTHAFRQNEWEEAIRSRRLGSMGATCNETAEQNRSTSMNCLDFPIWEEYVATAIPNAKPLESLTKRYPDQNSETQMFVIYPRNVELHVIYPSGSRRGACEDEPHRTKHFSRILVEAPAGRKAAAGLV